jgi:hypothetical protein
MAASRTVGRFIGAHNHDAAMLAPPRHQGAVTWALFLRSIGFRRRLFLSPRRQTADEHKRDQDGNKNSKLQRVHHARCLLWEPNPRQRDLFKV